MLAIFSTPMNTRMMGSSSHGTIVTRNPTRAQTLTLVMVLTTISTRPVNARPMREWTMSIPRKSLKRWMLNAVYATYVNAVKIENRFRKEACFRYCSRYE